MQEGYKRLLNQINFIIEIDKLKEILRQNVVVSRTRQENDAEHTWHLAIMSVILSEYFIDSNLDITKVLKMILIHDIVEIYAGDTFCFDQRPGVRELKKINEQKSAKQIFDLLPPEQSCEYYNLWQEFENKSSPEAIFASCMDRFQPFLLNYNTEGHTWQMSGVNREMVRKRMCLLEEYMPQLWAYVEEAMEDSVRREILRDK